MIYMDNAATSFPKPPEVVTAVTAALMAPASPGRSGHAEALAASRAIHKARKNMAKIFGLGDNSRLIFLPNISWALNTALEGFGLKEGDHVISSALEHNSVTRPLSRLAAERGVIWEIAPIDGRGLSDPAEFKKLLRPSTKMIALNHASNVTGALASPKDVKIAADHLPLLLDTAQTAGALELRELSQWADMIAFTGHKGLLGPTGTGGLWFRESLEIRPLAVGGTGSASESLKAPDFLPDAFEAGTANTHGLAGLAASTDFILKTTEAEIRRHEMRLAGRFLDGLAQIGKLRVFGPRRIEKRVATISLALEGWSSSDLSLALEKEHGILTRAGLHCSPLTHQALGSLKSGGLTRFSFGFYNTEAEIDLALRAIEQLALRKR